MSNSLRSDFPETLRKEILTHPLEKNIMAEILSVLRDPLRELFFDPNYIQKTEDPIGPFARQIKECLEETARVMQITTPNLRFFKSSSDRIEVIGSSEHYMIVHSSFLRGPFLPDHKFQIVRALDQLVYGREIAMRLNPAQLQRLFFVIIRYFMDALDLGGYPERELKIDLKRFKRVFPKKLRPQIESLVNQLVKVWDRVQFDAWIKGIQLTGNRVALLLTGDIAAAFRVILTDERMESVLSEHERGGISRLGAVAKSAALRDLIKFASSDEYFRLRMRIGRGVPPGRIKI